MKQLMVDIETMGTNKDGPIIQIGAVYYSLATGEMGKEFLVNIDLEDCMKYGARPDAGAIYFWLRQNDEARNSILDVDRKFEYELEALTQFNEFAQPAKEIWSHSTFDFVMLHAALRRREIRPLFHFRQARDIHTLTSLAGFGKKQIKNMHAERTGIHHNALHDAKYQVGYCHECYKRIFS